MLAYVFWHRPGEGVEVGEYEARLLAFQATLGAAVLAAQTFRVARLPWQERGGYEDWYLVEDWAVLGALNAAALSSGRRPAHDRAAGLSGEGWGGVYALLRGAGAPPQGTRWLDKPRGEPLDELLDRMGAGAAWQRQLVLGPAPELCVGEGSTDGRVRLTDCNTC